MGTSSEVGIGSGARRASGDGVQALGDQLLDQLSPGRLSSIITPLAKGLALLAYRALQFRIFHGPAQHMQQIEVLTSGAMLATDRRDCNSGQSPRDLRHPGRK
jgi:hypothetical protein